jgi:hypothetical protein
MSNKRYLEIDSTYRNREQFPNPSNFTVLISQSGTKDAVHAYDPVSKAAPTKTWVPNELELKTATVPYFETNTGFEFIVTVTNGPTGENASKTPNYYSGYPIEMMDTNSTPKTEPVKIVTWTYLSSGPSEDTFIMTVDPIFTEAPFGVIRFAPASTINDFKQGIIFIPDGYTADSYYTNEIIYNENISLLSTTQQNNWRTIISYDGTNKLAGFDTTKPINPANPTNDNWMNFHTLSVRKAPPQYVGTLNIPTDTINTNISFLLPSNTIINVGDFIRFTGDDEKDVTCRVINYTGEGQAEDLTSSPQKVRIFPYIVTVSCILPFVPTALQTFEVLQFSYDNAVPFCYSGSLVSQQEMVCYEIELVNLILPNKTLLSGGRTAFYPYLHVELQNVSGASAGNTCIIYSNNPNTRKMLFRTAIDDIPNPGISPFIKIDGDGMVQTVKFKPNDNFKFGVYLPNGDPLTLVDQDTSSPVVPDPLVQVSALFSIRRL